MLNPFYEFAVILAIAAGIGAIGRLLRQPLIVSRAHIGRFRLSAPICGRLFRESPDLPPLIAPVLDSTVFAGQSCQHRRELDGQADSGADRR